MTLDEAIEHAEEVAEEHESGLKVYENLGKDRSLFKKEENCCKECAAEHRQLAEWLKDYKRLKEQEPKTGHWIEEFNDLEGEVRFTCSSCRKYQLFGTDFCYHCGSDNRKVEQ